MGSQNGCRAMGVFYFDLSLTFISQSKKTQLLIYYYLFFKKYFNSKNTMEK